MIHLRVDDYPSGSELCQIPADYAAMLAGFKQALGAAPFCLGVVFGFLPPGEIEALLRDPQIQVAAHGMTHSRHECESEAAVKEMRLWLGDERPAIIIPPMNIVRDYGLLSRHFDLILTGPHQEERKGWPQARWPAFYGRASELLALPELPKDGIIALHLTWEAAGDFGSIRELAARGYWRGAVELGERE